jgi:hypothetical protein
MQDILRVLDTSSRAERDKRGAASWLGLILLPPLVGGAVASAGVFVSLRAATVRQAQQTLMLVLD